MIKSDENELVMMIEGLLIHFQVEGRLDVLPMVESAYDAARFEIAYRGTQSCDNVNEDPYWEKTKPIGGNAMQHRRAE